MTSAAEPVLHIVTVRDGLDPREVARRHGLTPTHVFDDIMDAFVAEATAEQVMRLVQDADVVDVSRSLQNRALPQVQPPRPVGRPGGEAPGRTEPHTP